MMWAVVYTHKYGMDVGVAETEEDAHEYALGIVRKYKDDFDMDGDEDDLLRDWCEATGCQESIEVVVADDIPRNPEIPPPDEIDISFERSDLTDSAELTEYLTQPIE